MSRIVVMRPAAILFGLMAAVSTAPAVYAQAPSPPARDARPASSGTASVRGHVVAAATGQPLVSAQVRVEGAGTRVQRTTTTDQRGEYVFDDLPPGRFAVKVSKAGFLAAAYGQGRPHEDGTPVELSDGQAVTGVDLVLSRGGVIVARITDETGEPMSGVQLQVERYGFQYGWRILRPLSGSPLPYLNNRTDDTGQARLYGLPQGDYYVSAFGPVDRMGGGPPIPGIIAAVDQNHVYVPTYFPGVMAPETASRVHVDVDRETTINFALVAITRSRLTGIVRTSTGAVPYLPELTLVRPNGFSANSRAIHVDPDGSFAAGDLLPGDYFINVTVQAGDFADAPSERAVVPVTLTGTDVTGLVVTTGRGGVMRGRVVYETPPDSKEEGDAQVFLSSVDSPAQDQLRPHEELWDLDGTFEIAGLFGRGVVRVTNDADWILKAVVIDGRDVTDQAFDFSDGKPVNGVQVVMTKTSCTVTGSAFDTAGPSRAFTAVLFPEDRGQWTPWSRFIASASPDQNARFRITGLPPGRYLLAALDDLESGEAFNPDILARLADAATLIVVGEGETKDVALTVIKN